MAAEAIGNIVDSLRRALEQDIHAVEYDTWEDLPTEAIATAMWSLDPAAVRKQDITEAEAVAVAESCMEMIAIRDAVGARLVGALMIIHVGLPVNLKSVARVADMFSNFDAIMQRSERALAVHRNVAKRLQVPHSPQYEFMKRRIANDQTSRAFVPKNVYEQGIAFFKAFVEAQQEAQQQGSQEQGGQEQEIQEQGGR